jgi:hypothetical protein
MTVMHMAVWKIIDCAGVRGIPRAPVFLAVISLIQYLSGDKVLTRLEYSNSDRNSQYLKRYSTRTVHKKGSGLELWNTIRLGIYT